MILDIVIALAIFFIGIPVGLLALYKILATRFLDFGVMCAVGAAAIVVIPMIK
jgi:hypothetical protein